MLRGKWPRRWPAGMYQALGSWSLPPQPASQLLPRPASLPHRSQAIYSGWLTPTAAGKPIWASSGHRQPESTGLEGLVSTTERQHTCQGVTREESPGHCSVFHTMTWKGRSVEHDSEELNYFCRRSELFLLAYFQLHPPHLPTRCAD